MRGCRRPLLFLAAFLAAVGPAASLDGQEKQPGRPLVVGHRGLFRSAPENTLVGMRACLELRVGIELDVRRSKDGQLIVLHDATLDRTTNGKGKAADVTLAELKKFDAGAWFDPAFRDERIPTLDEVFALRARHPAAAGLIAVDLKEADTEEDIVKLAQKHGVLDRLVFIGLAITSADVRQRLHKADPKAQAARLVAATDDLADALKDPDADWLYVRHFPERPQVARIHGAGKRIFMSGPLVAEVDRVNWQKAANLGVDAVLTDEPLELARTLRAGNARTGFDRWEKEIAALEQREQDQPPPKNAVVFAGSSTIRLWDLKKSFPDLEAINRGFGGSQIADTVHFAPRLILKHEPRLVVFYAGDNDIAAGKSPEKVLEDFQNLVKAIHKDLPKTRVAFIAIKPSLARRKFVDAQRKANALVEAFCRKDERLSYVDVVKPMLDDDGNPRADLFVKDGLHMSPKGYDLWATLLKPHLR